MHTPDNPLEAKVLEWMLKNRGWHFAGELYRDNVHPVLLTISFTLLALTEEGYLRSRRAKGDPFKRRQFEATGRLRS
jgi:hypothetical protein